MKIFEYFDLGLFPDRAVLGTKTENQKQKREIKKFLVTLLMYVFVWLGILGQKILSLHQEGTPITWEAFNDGFIWVALVIATVIFPSVFPKVFVKMPVKQQNAEAGGWFWVKCCLAFQQGFFWQALLSLISPK